MTDGPEDPAGRGDPAGRRLAPGQRSRIRPVQWAGPVFGSLLTLGLWELVAHSSGSGWVQAIGAALAGVLLVGLVGPAFQLRRITVAVRQVPGDAEVGQSAELVLESNAPVRLRPLDPPGPATTSAGPTRGARTTVVDVQPRHRGVHPSVTIEVATGAPFGLLWWARRVALPLDHPLLVAPRPVAGEDPEPGGEARPGDVPRMMVAPTGEPRSLRPYGPGDSRHLVHWPTSAHVGELMVREWEQTRDDQVVIALDLSDDPERAERQAGVAFGAILGHLEAGRKVTLRTSEPNGPVTNVVHGRRDAGRRLARAVPGSASGAGPR
jgi:uncharacterized protein (DUF58 family)